MSSLREADARHVSAQGLRYVVPKHAGLRKPGCVGVGEWATLPQRGSVRTIDDRLESLKAAVEAWDAAAPPESEDGWYAVPERLDSAGTAIRSLDASVQTIKYLLLALQRIETAGVQGNRSVRDADSVPVDRPYRIIDAADAVYQQLRRTGTKSPVEVKSTLQGLGMPESLVDNVKRVLSLLELIKLMRRTGALQLPASGGPSPLAPKDSVPKGGISDSDPEIGYYGFAYKAAYSDSQVRRPPAAST